MIRAVSYTHLDVYKRQEIHLPSGVNEWQIPLVAVDPKDPFEDALLEPEEEQETSYFAASLRIFNFSFIFIPSPSIYFKVYINYKDCRSLLYIYNTRMYVRSQIAKLDI